MKGIKQLTKLTMSNRKTACCHICEQEAQNLSALQREAELCAQADRVPVDPMFAKMDVRNFNDMLY